jgi:hypothetical protein
VASSKTGIWPVRIRGRGAGGIRGSGIDRWAPFVSDGGTVMGWQAGSRAEMGRGRRRAGPAMEKMAHDDFSILNSFPIE